MLVMLLKMSAVTALYVVLTVTIWTRVRGRTLTMRDKAVIGVIYGFCAVLSTHFGVDYGHMMLNVRDIGPLAAGLFFDPLSGVIAGLIGGVERYIVGTYFGIGAYTRVACSISTCLAGCLAAVLNIKIFKGKKPSAVYAFIMGAVMEVFHMYVVFITHRGDMSMACYVVKTCSGPMILFTGLGLAVSSLALRIMSGEWRNPFRHISSEKVPVSQRFQRWLFGITMLVLAVNFLFSYGLQTQSARQEAQEDLSRSLADIAQIYRNERASGTSVYAMTAPLSLYHVGASGTIDIVDSAGNIRAGDHASWKLPQPAQTYADCAERPGFFTDSFFGEESLCALADLGDGMYLLVTMSADEVYANRNAQIYEIAFADILLFTVIYVLISILVQKIVVDSLEMVNDSLSKITRGNLNEVVDVRSASEFASLSDDINQTVDVLKGYIQAAEKRIEQELEMARDIQDSALPKNFAFPRKDFEIYATMDPAKEVGGDFYDFFFVDRSKLALVIADVSGKGIPAALFMMRAKTAIRGLAEAGREPAEILYRANNVLCEGNDAEMFVTVWLGIIDLENGVMKCANAGHEYPALMRAGERFELFKDKHGFVLAGMDGVRFKEYELTFRPGDHLFVYTDGIPEAINEETEQYGTERLLRILNEVKDGRIEDALPAVRQDIAEFAGSTEQFDDITMLGFTYLGNGAHSSPGMIPS